MTISNLNPGQKFYFVDKIKTLSGLMMKIHPYTSSWKMFWFVSLENFHVDSIDIDAEVVLENNNRGSYVN